MFHLQKRLDAEGRIKAFLLLALILLSATTVYFYQTKKRDWQIESEGLVKSNIPVGTPRTQVAKWLVSSGYYTRDSRRNVTNIHIGYSTLKHTPNNLHDTVVVDVYFDDAQKVSGYGSAYPTRVTWP